MLTRSECLTGDRQAIDGKGGSDPRLSISMTVPPWFRDGDGLGMPQYH